jgi:hypothetical protein
MVDQNGEELSRQAEYDQRCDDAGLVQLAMGGFTDAQ